MLQIELLNSQIHCFDDYKFAKDFINNTMKKFIVPEDI